MRTNNTYTITWSCADKVSTTYTIDVVTNIANSVEKICPILHISGRDWDLRLSEPAASDVTYSFDAVNGYSGQTGDIEVDITISKGETTGTFRTTTTQFAIYAILVAVDPYEDDTYRYGDCDVEWSNE